MKQYKLKCSYSSGIEYEWALENRVQVGNTISAFLKIDEELGRLNEYHLYPADTIHTTKNKK